MGEEVIYGDTDSIMVNTSSATLDEALTVGRKLKSEVNKRYRQLEIDIDAVYKCILLLKKKKYAGLKLDINASKSNGSAPVAVKEMKGLDLVRRDWAEVAKDAGNRILEILLSGDQKDNILDRLHADLTQTAETIASGKVPLEKYQIAKQLTKAPKDYSDAKSLPHVNVATRLNKQSSRQYRQGDTIFYVVCKDGTSNAATQRAYHLSELKENASLEIDANYYLSQQIHPIVARLCEPIEGTSNARIAECLGLDATAYRAADKSKEDDRIDIDSSLLNLASCDPFEFQCPNPACKQVMFMNAPIIRQAEGLKLALHSCDNPACKQIPAKSPATMLNSLQSQMRKHMQLYYKGWLQCEDATCGYRTRRTPLRISRAGKPKCPQCPTGILFEEYSAVALLSQLTHFQEMFSLDTAYWKLTETERNTLSQAKRAVEDTYQRLHKMTVHWLNSNAYSEINLGLLFSTLLQPTKTSSGPAFHMHVA